MQVGCIRETFEETGILPFKLPSKTLLAQRAAVNANAAAFADLVKQLPRDDFLATLRSMRHWVTFVTPLFERKRFDTGFYLLLLPKSLSSE